MKSSNFLFTLFFFSLLTACSESSTEEKYLSISPAILTFSADGGTQTFKISSNTSWTVTAPDSSNFTIVPNSGNGDKNINVTIPSKIIVQEEQTKIMIKTAEGKIENLTIQQKGILLTGGTLQITNHSDFVYFNGKEGDTDSLRILCNIPWKVYGPEWIQAWNGNRWINLSPDRAIIEGGAIIKDGENTVVLYLRTNTSNNQESGLYDYIRVVPAYDNSANPVELGVVQLGKHHAVPNNVVTLANDIAWNYKCGSAVEKIYYCFADHEIKDGAIPWDSSIYSLPNDVTGYNGLNENTVYYIYTLGADGNNDTYEFYTRPYITGSSQNQPVAKIQNVSYTNSTWNWSVIKNEYCYLYSLWACVNSNYFEITDGMLALILNSKLHSNEMINDEANYYHISDVNQEYYFTTPYHIQIITWGVPANYNRLGSVIDRYRTDLHFATRSFSQDVIPSQPHSVSINKDELKKAYVRIK